MRKTYPLQAQGKKHPDRVLDAIDATGLRTDGRLLARYSPPEAAQRSLGDMTVGPDGTVYVSDSLAGDIWRLRPGAEGFATCPG